MPLTLIRSLILIIGWPILIGGSILLFVRGRAVYKLVKGSLVGKIAMVLVYTMLVEMYSLGIVSTAYMFSDSKSVYLVLPVFLAWFAVFVWSLRVLIAAGQEAKKISGQK
ncbi:MAG: hypothetical protein Q7R92_02520 [bacterium]|nr:hypothetical protein [bacterium]